MSDCVTLPWPPQELSPNWRGHWRKKARAARTYRHACGWACKAAGLRVPAGELIALHVEFVPPNRRHYDDDNLVGAFKVGRDGIADALGVDDTRFRLQTTVVSTELGGFVRVRLAGI